MSRFLYEARCKITTRLIALDNCLPGRLHPLWEITPLDLYDIQQANVKVEMLSGMKQKPWNIW